SRESGASPLFACGAVNEPCVCDRRHRLYRPRARGCAPRARARSGGGAPGRFLGNALEAASFADAIPPDATVVHLVGTPHPSPAKAAEFERVDFASIRATVAAPGQARARPL